MVTQKGPGGEWTRAGGRVRGEVLRAEHGMPGTPPLGLRVALIRPPTLETRLPGTVTLAFQTHLSTCSLCSVQAVRSGGEVGTRCGQ